MNAEWIHFGPTMAARVVAGSGPRLLWVHPYTLDSRAWDSLWPLMPDCHHIGVELPGHGRSGPYDPQQSLPDLGRQMGRHALEWGVEHLVGLSFGGTVALQIALEWPGRFASLTLGAPGLAGGPEDREIGHLHGQLGALFRIFGPGTSLTDQWMASKLFAGAADDPALWADLHRMVMAHRWQELRYGPLWNLHLHPQSLDQLAQLEIPTVVLVGDRELPTFKQIAAILSETMPHCEQLPLTGGVYHLCMLQRPAESVAQIERQLATSRLPARQ